MNLNIKQCNILWIPDKSFVLRSETFTYTYISPFSEVLTFLPHLMFNWSQLSRLVSSEAKWKQKHSLTHTRSSTGTKQVSLVTTAPRKKEQWLFIEPTWLKEKEHQWLGEWTLQQFSISSAVITQVLEPGGSSFGRNTGWKLSSNPNPVHRQLRVKVHCVYGSDDVDIVSVTKHNLNRCHRRCCLCPQCDGCFNITEYKNVEVFMDVDNMYRLQLYSIGWT